MTQSNSDSETPRESREPTGAGAEAAEGLHAHEKGRTGERDERDNSSLTDRPTGNDGERKGSEPLTESEQHRSGYGGDAGMPKRGYGESDASRGADDASDGAR